MLQPNGRTKLYSVYACMYMETRSANTCNSMPPNVRQCIHHTHTHNIQKSFNNNPTYRVPECQKTSVALADRKSRAHETGLEVWWNMKVLSVDINTANEQLSTVWLFREFQTEGAVQRKAWSMKWMLVVGFRVTSTSTSTQCIISEVLTLHNNPPF